MVNDKEASLFKGRVLLVTGGTGSFGNAVVRSLLATQVKEIRILSRDEKKQDDMRREFASDRLVFFIGDVREMGSIRNAFNGVDYVFHAAALKQVPSCEFFPMEAVKTNVLGTENVLSAAVEAGVRKVICLSTDKAVYPVNAMGMSKAMMEKVVVAKARTAADRGTVVCCTRYGNVMCSRGSVIPLFMEQIMGKQPITVTDPRMTRFLMSLEEAFDLVLYAFQNAESGDIMVQKAPSCRIGELALAMRELFSVDNEIKIIGVRHGEKMYEVLLTKEERARALDFERFYRIPPDMRSLNYDKYLVEGNSNINVAEEYSSENTKILTIEEIKEKLLSVPLVREKLAQWRNGR